MAQMISPLPARKVVASSLGSAVATFVLWLAETRLGLQMPPPVQAAVILIVTFVTGYLVPPAARDQINTDASH
jgi:hypothetical protein